VWCIWLPVLSPLWCVCVVSSMHNVVCPVGVCMCACACVCVRERECVWCIWLPMLSPLSCVCVVCVVFVCEHVCGAFGYQCCLLDRVSVLSPLHTTLCVLWVCTCMCACARVCV